MNIDDNKLKALDNVMSQIEKQFGKGAVIQRIFILRDGDGINEY